LPLATSPALWVRSGAAIAAQARGIVGRKSALSAKDLWCTWRPFKTRFQSAPFEMELAYKRFGLLRVDDALNLFLKILFDLKLD
jgi:hypothetical protein